VGGDRQCCVTIRGEESAVSEGTEDIQPVGGKEDEIFRSRGCPISWGDDLGSKPHREFRGITGDQKIQQVVIAPTSP